MGLHPSMPAHLARVSRRIIVLGDATLDLFFHSREATQESSTLNFSRVVPGGTGLNVAVGLRQLNCEVLFVCRFAKDFIGNWIQAYARQFGILIPRFSSSRLSSRVVLVWLKPNGDRDFLSFTPRAADEDLQPSQIPWKQIKQGRLLFTTGALLRTEPARSSVLRSLRFASKNKVLTAIDLNIRLKDPRNWNGYHQALRSATSLCDFVIGTEDELKQVIDQRHQPKSRIVVIKRGALGSVYQQDGTQQRVAPFRVRAIDTTGAGDAFDAAFLASLIAGMPLSQCCTFGNAAGAIATTIEGSSNSMPDSVAIKQLLATRRSKP